MENLKEYLMSCEISQEARYKNNTKEQIISKHYFLFEISLTNFIESMVQFFSSTFQMVSVAAQCSVPRVCELPLKSSFITISASQATYQVSISSQVFTIMTCQLRKGIFFRQSKGKHYFQLLRRAATGGTFGANQRPCGLRALRVLWRNLSCHVYF